MTFKPVQGIRIALLIPLFLFMTITLPGCPPTEPWRSTLYPEGWTPGYQDGEGRFLHDFTFAGNHNGEDPPTTPPGAVYDVTAAPYNADNSGATDATAAIQQAIDDAGAAGGGIVFIPSGLYRCDDLLSVSDSGVVIRGEGPGQTQVYFTRDTNMASKRSITFSKSTSGGAEILLAEDGVNQSFVVKVHDSSGLTVGEHVNVGWVITDDFVAEHNMTGTWYSFNGQWKPFFRRQVVAVNDTVTPHEVTLDVPLRYPAKTRDSASIREESGYLTDCGIEHLALSNAVDWSAAWDFERVHVLAFQNAVDCWVNNVHSFESPVAAGTGYHLQSGGIYILSSKRITVTDCRMEQAQNRGGGGCGYLFEISKSNEVLTRDCVGIRGRHNFIQNWDFGTTGCVWLRCDSDQGNCLSNEFDTLGYACHSEYHHSLAMACLVDQCTIQDGWYGGNRQDWSSGAGLTVTESVYWNTSGGGVIRSWQYGWGYIIGTQSMLLNTALIGGSAEGSEPEDYAEGQNTGAYLVPQSLYEDQRLLRVGP